MNLLGSLAEMITLWTFDLSNGTSENNQTCYQCLYIARKEVIQDEWQELVLFYGSYTKRLQREMSRSFSYEAVQSYHSFIKVNEIRLSGRLFVLTSPNKSDLKCRKLGYEAGEIVYITCVMPLGAHFS